MKIKCWPFQSCMSHIDVPTYTYILSKWDGYVDGLLAHFCAQQCDSRKHNGTWQHTQHQLFVFKDCLCSLRKSQNIKEPSRDGNINCNIFTNALCQAGLHPFSFRISQLQNPVYLPEMSTLGQVHPFHT